MRSIDGCSEHYPDIPFERYADDVICHCRQRGASAMRCDEALEAAVCGSASWNCTRRRPRSSTARMPIGADDYPEQRFDFLGYTFRPRQAMNRAGRLFVSFSPAVSDKAAKAMRRDRASLAAAASQRSRPWRTLPDGSVRCFVAGCTTTGVFYPSALAARSAHTGPFICAMGAAEIQDVCEGTQSGHGTGCARFRSPPARPVRALAPGDHPAGR